MRLGFIGTGNVGGTLATKLGSKGHSIFLGVRSPKDSDAQKLAQEIGSHASVHSIQEAADRAEVIFVATPWSVTEELMKSLKNLNGKIIVDCTNPLAKDLSGLVLGHSTSAGEQIQAWSGSAKVVKAFNTVGFNIMQEPVLENRKAVMFFCGDDAEARHKVQLLIDDVGFEPVDAGPLSSARMLEPLALLWIASAYKFGLGRDFALGILRKKTP